MEDLVQVLTKFHREILVPDIERIVGAAVEGSERRLRDEMHTLFDALAHQIQDLKVDGLKAQVRTLEARLDG